MTQQARRDIFQAIADPTRRDIIQLLARKPLNLNTIAENFEMSRPAISQHIKILEACGMVQIQKQGRERYCNVQMEQLEEVSNWVAGCKAFWNSKLDALEDFLDATDYQE